MKKKVSKLWAMLTIIMALPVLMVMGGGTGIMNKLGALLGGGQAQAAPAQQGHYSSMVIEKGDTAYNTMAKIIALLPAVGIKMRIWEYTVPAQMAVSWGFGSPLTPDNQGYIWFAAGLAATGFDVGTVLLSHENHSRRNAVPITEFNDSMTHTSDFTTLVTARDRNKKTLLALPEDISIPAVGQDSRLVIDYTAIVLVAEDIWGFDIPVTVYE